MHTLPLQKASWAAVSAKPSAVIPMSLVIAARARVHGELPFLTW